jgi:hypothetical protein
VYVPGVEILYLKIWDVLYRNLKEIKEYQEWLGLNENNEYIFVY